MDKLDELMAQLSEFKSDLNKTVNESYGSDPNSAGADSSMIKKDCSCERCPSCLKKSEESKEKLVIKSNGQWELSKAKDKPNPVLAGAVMLGTLYSLHQAKQSKTKLEAAMVRDKDSAEITRTPASVNAEHPDNGRNLEAHKPKLKNKP
jgi:hypothetical protein